MRNNNSRLSAKIMFFFMIISAIVVLCNTTCLASTSLPDSLYDKAHGSKTCTLASAAMMMRACAYLNGYSDWASITEDAIKSDAWVSGVGLGGSFSYSFSDNSISVTQKDDLSGISVVGLKQIMDQHPEGIVLYCFNNSYQHAVFLTDYEGDTFFCADPWGGNYSGRRLALASSTLANTFGNQSGILSNVKAYWYVRSYNFVEDVIHPSVTGYITDVTTSSYSIMVYASDNKELESIGCRSWNDVIGIDAASWQTVAVTGKSGEAFYTINISDLGGYQNTVYHTELWAKDSKGQYSLEHTQLDVMIETVKPVVTEAYVENITPTSYEVYVKGTDNATVYKTIIRTMYDDILENKIIWNESDPFTNEGRFTIDISQFDGVQNVKYYSDVWICDLCGNWSNSVRVAEVVLESIPPEITVFSVGNTTSQGYDVSVIAEDNSALSKIRIKTWHSGMSENDALWKTISINNEMNVMENFHIDVSDFKNAQDVTYYTKAYAYDMCGNVSDESITVETLVTSNNPPEITNCQTVNIGPRGYDIVCKAADDHGVAYYVFGTWHEPMYIEDALWEAVEADANESITYHVDPSRFYWASGVNYYTRVIAFDANDERSEELEVTVFVPALDLYAEREESLTMYLPASLTAIQSGAFEGVSARYFVLPATVKTIEADSFPAGSTVYLYGQGMNGLSASLFSGAGTVVEMGNSGNNLLAGDLLNSDVTYIMRNGAEIMAMTATVEEPDIVGQP